MKTVFQTVNAVIYECKYGILYSCRESKISVWCVGNNEIKFVNYYSQTVSSWFGTGRNIIIIYSQSIMISTKLGMADNTLASTHK